MKTSATNRRLRTLLTDIRDGRLTPRPEFQRRLVWTNKHKQEFIRTVLEDFPFPEIYIAAGTVDAETGEGDEMLVDGQQRITTLHQYFVGSQDLRLGDLPTYAKLSPDKQLAFLEYEVVVRDLGKKTIDEIKEVFTRINSTKYSLNAMEIHNARFDGAFKKFGEEVSRHPFFEEFRVFKTNDIRRMGDLVFALTLIITVMTTYFNRDDLLDDFLEKYNDEFDGAEQVGGELDKVFSYAMQMNLPPQSRAWRKAELLTLLVEIHRKLFRDQALPVVPMVAGSTLRDFFNLVDAAGQGAPATDLAVKYYKASIQATNDRSNRIARGEIVSTFLALAPKT